MLDGGGGKIQVAINCKVNVTPPPRLHVVVERACDLQTVTMFGLQDPYIHLTVLPIK